eukprot:3897042-Rhodomonas_salina.1
MALVADPSDVACRLRIRMLTKDFLGAVGCARRGDLLCLSVVPAQVPSPRQTLYCMRVGECGQAPTSFKSTGISLAVQVSAALSASWCV